MGLDFNHLTLAVRDVSRSVEFYVQIVGLQLHAVWEAGAYLTAGSTWICLSLDPDTGPRADYTHFAFGCPAEEFAERAARIRGGAQLWKDNTSEGDSLYFLDPDGHQLELHVGDLQTRLKSCRIRPYRGMRFFPETAGN